MVESYVRNIFLGQAINSPGIAGSGGGKALNLDVLPDRRRRGHITDRHRRRVAWVAWIPTADPNRMLHAGHCIGVVGQILNDAAPVASGLQSDAGSGAAESAAMDGHKTNAILSDTADGTTVADTERAIFDIDVFAAHRDVVVTAIECVVDEVGVLRADVDTVGVLGIRCRRIDGDATDRYVRVIFHPDVFFGRILEVNAGDLHTRRISDAHFLRAS